MQERRPERTRSVDAPVHDDPGAQTEHRGTVRSDGGATRWTRPVAGTPPATAVVNEVHTTHYDPYANRRRAVERLVQGIWLLFGIIQGILAIRFILKLLGANENAGFASLIYGASAPFVAPFIDLFINPAGGGSILELTTLVAMIVYMLLGWLIVKLIRLLTGTMRAPVD